MATEAEAAVTSAAAAVVAAVETAISTDETPATTVAETPAATLAETPVTTVAETPAATVAETPATKVAEAPATTVAETPAATAAETPAAPSSAPAEPTAAKEDAAPAAATKESPAEPAVKEPVNHESEWKFPMEKDGWVLAHDVIRSDMVVLGEALKALELRLKGGASLHKWEVDCLQKWWDNFHHNVHEHHRHEEEIFFVDFKTRFELPAKMTDDHGTLMKGMDECGDIIRSLSPSEDQPASLEKVSQLGVKFPAFEASMKLHLEEEEKETLPLYRQHYSPKEGKVLVDRTLKMLKPMDNGWFFHNMTPEEMKAVAKQEGIPAPVAQFLLFPNAAKFNKKFTVLIQAVKEGKEPAKPKGLFACFG